MKKKNLVYLLTMMKRYERISTDVDKILREVFELDVFERIARISTPQKCKSILEVKRLEKVARIT